MHHTYDRNQNIHNRNWYFIILNSLFLTCLWSGQAMAAQTCRTTIPSTTPTSDFVLNSDGTARDQKTGLMWKRCPEGYTWSSSITCTLTGGGAAKTFIWQKALQQGANATFPAGAGGFTDWRLPNIKELDSIVEQQCINPSINSSLFPDTPSTYFWSASLYVSNPTFALSVNFSNGADYKENKIGSYYVRLVRGGQ